MNEPEPKAPITEVSRYVWRDANNQFWFVDETENWGGGPYDTQELCEQALASYCEWLEKGS